MKTLKFFSFLLFLVIAASACSDDDGGNVIVNDEDPVIEKRAYFTFTVNGNGLDGVTFTKEYEVDEHGGIAYMEPENNYESVTANYNAEVPGVKATFVYLDGIIQPMAINENTNEDTSNVEVIFEHNGQTYQVQSTYGNCVSQNMEIFTITDSFGKAAFKVNFSGSFMPYVGTVSEPFEITGEVEIQESL